MENSGVVKFNANLLQRVENAVGITNKLLNVDFRRINVIHFDDHRVYTSGVNLALKSLLPNIQIQEFTSGPEALTHVENCFRKNEKLDIIITGIQQPIYDGFSFAKAVRGIETKYNKNTPIMILSMCVGEDMATSINKAIEDRLWNVALCKTVSGEKIFEALKFLIENPSQSIKYKVDPETIKENRQTEKEILTFLYKTHHLNVISEKIRFSARTIEVMTLNMMKRYEVDSLDALLNYAKDNSLID